LYKDTSCRSWIDPKNPPPPVPEVPIPEGDVDSNDGISTQGGIVTVRGFNFGTSDFDVDAEIRFPDIQKNTIPLYHNHERMEFVIPPGSGGSEDTVRKGRLAIGDYVASFSYRYKPPNIDTISPQELPTNTAFSSSEAILDLRVVSLPKEISTPQASLSCFI
jgi:hypothetical protein